MNFQMFKLVLEKVEEPEIKLPTIANCWMIEKARKFQKNTYFCLIDYVKAFDSVDHNKLWKILKEMGVPDHFYVFWETHMWVKKQPLEPYMEQRNGS